MPATSPPASVIVYEQLTAAPPPPGLSAEQAADLHAQGRAMRDALLDDLRRLSLPGLRCVVPADGCALPARLPQAVEPVPLPATQDPATLLRQQAHAGALVWAIAPETDGMLERLARAVPPPRWLGCSADAIALATGKRSTTRRLAAAGLPVPDHFASIAQRWITKPDDGAGATDTHVHPDRTAAEADAAARAAASAAASAVEPWIDGEALSLSLACRPGQAPRLLSINRQHIDVDPQGALHFRGVEPAAVSLHGTQGRPLQDLASRIAQALPGLAGYVGVDLVWHATHGPVLVEVNPRLTSAYVGLSQALGENVAGLLLATHAT